MAATFWTWTIALVDDHICAGVGHEPRIHEPQREDAAEGRSLPGDGACTPARSASWSPASS